jgi:hypothetical protein
MVLRRLVQRFLVMQNGGLTRYKITGRRIKNEDSTQKLDGQLRKASAR